MLSTSCSVESVIGVGRTQQKECVQFESKYCMNLEKLF